MFKIMPISKLGFFGKSNDGTEIYGTQTLE